MTIISVKVVTDTEVNYISFYTTGFKKILYLFQ